MQQKRIFILISAIVLAISTSAKVGAIDLNRPHGEQEHEHEQEKENRQEYTCPMHPEIIMDHPGNCPKCGMKLVLKKRRLTQKPKTTRASRATCKRCTLITKCISITAMKRCHVNHIKCTLCRGTNRTTCHICRCRCDPPWILRIQMSREGSGTSWLPDSSPMYGKMFMFGNDMLMLHGAIFPRYTYVSTQRGDDRIDAPNWIMGMYLHPLGDSAQLGGRLMMSLDPLTEGGRGYPLLFQSGESWHDQPLHDRQHPHDLFDELSISYSQKFEDSLSAYLYFGYPGEPALGPPTFMHRPSAMDDPDAPLGHHWQDSSHVTFGVATGGLVWRTVKIEGSVFTGREPDEDRYDFDQPRFDSFSGRISWNPTKNLALQVSHGYVKSPEALEPDVKRHR